MITISFIYIKKNKLIINKFSKSNYYINKILITHVYSESFVILFLKNHLHTKNVNRRQPIQNMIRSFLSNAINIYLLHNKEHVFTQEFFFFKNSYEKKKTFRCIFNFQITIFFKITF